MNLFPRCLLQNPGLWGPIQVEGQVCKNSRTGTARLSKYNIKLAFAFQISNLY